MKAENELKIFGFIDGDIHAGSVKDKIAKLVEEGESIGGLVEWYTVIRVKATVSRMRKNQEAFFKKHLFS